MNFEELESVRRKLERLPCELIVAFAAKQAARSLPLLSVRIGETPPFGFWPEAKRVSYLDAVCRCVDLIWHYSKNKETLADAAFRPDDAFKAAVAAKPAELFKAAFGVAAYAAFDDTDDAAAAAARTASQAAFRAADISRRGFKEAADELRNTDLAHLADMRISSSTEERGAAFLAEPLFGRHWDEAKPVVNAFAESVRALFVGAVPVDAKLAAFLERYLKRCLGTQADIPYEIASLGPAAVYAYSRGLKDAKDRIE